MHDLPLQGVEGPIDSIVLLVEFRSLWVRLDNLLTQLNSGRRFRYVFEDLGCHPPQKRCPVGWSLVGSGAIYGSVVDIGLQLPPEPASRTASCDPDLLFGYAETPHCL